MGLGIAYSSDDENDGAEARLRWYQAAVAVAPENTAALLGLAVALRDKGDLDASIVIHNEVIRVAHEFLAWLCYLRQCSPAQGGPDGAILRCKDALRLDPTSPYAHLFYGLTLLYIHDPDGAITDFKEGIRFHPEVYLLHFNLGVTLKRYRRDYAGAVAALRETVKLNRSWPKSAQGTRAQSPAQGRLGWSGETRAE